MIFSYEWEYRVKRQVFGVFRMAKMEKSWDNPSNCHMFCNIASHAPDFETQNPRLEDIAFNRDVSVFFQPSNRSFGSFRSVYMHNFLKIGTDSPVAPVAKKQQKTTTQASQDALKLLERVRQEGKLSVLLFSRAISACAKAGVCQGSTG